MKKEKLKTIGADALKSAQKGITLIALVITIIVMLILVAVTISMAVNGGLFEYAQRAGTKTNEATAAEQLLASGRVEIDGVVYNSIDEFVNSGKSGGITASAMQSNLATYLGKEVNYGVQYSDVLGENKWEIFYADKNHIYLITKGYVAGGPLNITGYSGTSDFTSANLQSKYPAVAAGLFNKTYDPSSNGSELKYSNLSDNMKATQYLLDSGNWTSYVSSEVASWAIGGPTLEMFVDSYNVYYPDRVGVVLHTPEASSNGYNLELNNMPSNTYLNSSVSYWLAGPSSSGSSLVYYMYGGGNGLNNVMHTASFISFRPVVCLKQGVAITWNETTKMYDLK